jgi:hypothetical protein
MRDTTKTTDQVFDNHRQACANGRQVFDTDKGSKLTLNGQGMQGDYKVISWHSFDDYGQTLETVTVKNSIWGTNPVEIYSTDGGETFTLDCE